jgi:SNF2 family DNA or RNA helicase
VPEPLFSVLAHLATLDSESDSDARRSAFADLREALGDLGSEKIEPDGFIRKIRIAYASNFSLDVRTTSGSFDFDPILFARHVREQDHGDLIDESEAALLTEDEQSRFRIRFRNQQGGQRSYLLSDGTVLYVDPKLGQALDVVREKQKAPAEERRDFIRAPQRVLREELGLDSVDDDEAADRLFIETLQFSERVRGVDIWQTPVLPWIKPAPNSWLPESFGLRIGEEPNLRQLPLEDGQARELLSALERARERGDDSVEYRGESVPTSPATIKALTQIVELEEEIAALEAESSEPNGKAQSLATYFLKVDDNFEELDYSRISQLAEEPDEFVPPDLPCGSRSDPKPHQIAAFNWLTEAWARRLPGVLLADDMGLGKTYQSLTFLAWVRENSVSAKPFLIVAPTGLLKNWLEEINQHLESGVLGPIIEAYGSGLKNFRSSEGRDIHGGTSHLDVSQWSNAGVILTTYETMRDYHMSFARLPFSVIIYDEIQKLKNPASQMSRASKALNAQFQIGMTGTPVENRLQDLWSISDTLFPGFLGASREFEKKYPAENEDALRNLQTKLIEPQLERPPFMLRRMKEDILDGLPEKQVVTYKVQMPPPQAAAYDQVLARARALKGNGSKGAMLKVLHMLRGSSLHPQAPHAVANFSEYIGASARLSKTFDILDALHESGEKALIFCEDLDMQAFLAAAISERYGSITSPHCINGGVAGVRRQQMVAEFQARADGFDVMVLSPKAGGVGLTITAANHVIHLSRWWNPAVEDQATDRVYRIGQQRPVTVHIPIAVHPDEVIGPSSFDLQLHELMQRKRKLSRGLLLPPESETDLQDLWSQVLDGGVSDPEAEPSGEPDDFESLSNWVSASEIHPEDGPNFDEIGAAYESIRNPETNQEPRRETLSVRPSPTEVGERRATEVRRVVFQAGGLRDWTIFAQHTEGETISSLEIVDPYCCADASARRRLVEFISRFATHSNGLERVVVTSFDARSLRDPHEANGAQWSDLDERFSQKFPNLDYRFDLRSRRSRGDLHDRFVTAFVSSGDKVIWDLGRGVDGVMTARYDCVVNALREPVDSSAMH